MRARLFRTVLAASMFTFAPIAAHADDLDAYARAVDEHPDDAKAYEAYATAAIAQRRYDDAINKLKVGVARVPQFKRGYYLLAFAYRSKQAWADAADYYRVAIDIHQQENEASFGLGKSLEGLGDTRGAVAAFQNYIEHEKDPTKARFVDAARAEVLKLQGGAAPASAAPAASAPSTATADVAALKAEADALKNQGRFADAEVAYKRAIAADPNNQDLYNDLGNTLFSLKRYDDAALAFRDATSRDANYAIGWYNLANALRKADRKGEAVDAYRHYMALQPNDPDPYFGMGQTLKGMGDTQGAIKAFHRYLEMETRPEQQKWVEKARQELQALESGQHSQLQVPREPAGKVGLDEKSTGFGFPGGSDGRSDLDALLPIDERHPSDPSLRDLHDPFAAPAPDDADGLMNPFDHNRSLPGTAPGPATASPVPTSLRVRDYGKAVAAYREALAAHAERVSTRYDRGVVAAISGHNSDAITTWDTIALDDHRVLDARHEVERVRGSR